MKKKITISLLLILAGTLLTSALYAQTPPKDCCGDAAVPTYEVGAPAYKYLKQAYDYKAWTPSASDRYVPAAITALAVLAPGGGQIACGEPVRGALFTGTAGILGYTGMNLLAFGLNNDSMAYQVSGYTLLAGTLAVWIWSVIDANHVAKVKNLYINDLLGNYGKSCSMTLAPDINVRPTGGGYAPTAGLAMRLTF